MDNELKPESRFKRSKLQFLMIGAGLVLLVFAFYIASLWSGQRESMGLALLVIIMMPGGGFLIYKGIQRQGDHEAVIVGTEKPDKNVKINSLNIYARKDVGTGYIYPERVAFEWIDKPSGQPQQCLNNHKWYYVHLNNLDTNTLKPLTLPDQQYFSPREFANVITMPKHKDLFTREASLIQKVAPWVMFAFFVASIFAMVLTTPAPV